MWAEGGMGIVQINEGWGKIFLHKRFFSWTCRGQCVRDVGGGKMGSSKIPSP